MTFARIRRGKKGELLASSFLERQGYKILEKNYKTRYGEIDIIGNDKGCVVFVEVRAKASDNFCAPEYTIDKRKQLQVAKAALVYIKLKHLQDKDCRFDVVCIRGVDSKSPNTELIKDAFELDNWYGY